MSETVPSRPSAESKLEVDIPRVDWNRVVRLLMFFGVAGLIVVLLALVYESLMVPVSVSAFLTYLLLPLVELLERRGVRRIYAVSGLLIASLALIAIGVIRLAPELYMQAMSLIQLVPVAVNHVLAKWLPMAEQFVVNLGIMQPTDVHMWFSASSLLGRLNSQLESGVRGLWSTGATLVEGILNLVLIPVMTFFMLNDYDDFERRLQGLIPRDLIPAVGVIMHKVHLTLRSVLKGQVIVAGILAVLYVIGLSAVGLQQAVAIGVVAGICRIIPYLDIVVGSVLSVIVFLSDFPGWGQVVSVALVFLVVQAIDGLFITPRVVGERVGLHPLMVITSVLAFADWLGFWGILVALPVVAITKALLVTARPFYLASGLYDPRQQRQDGDSLPT